MSETFTCRECGRDFESDGYETSANYCSYLCRADATEKAVYDRIHLNSAVYGAIGELRVAADLLSRGYEVFRSVSATGSCDLIALKPADPYPIPLRVEVRSSTLGQAGNISVPIDEDDYGRFDCLALVLPTGEVFYVPELGQSYRPSPISEKARHKVMAAMIDTPWSLPTKPLGRRNLLEQAA